MQTLTRVSQLTIPGVSPVEYAVEITMSGERPQFEFTPYLDVAKERAKSVFNMLLPRHVQRCREFVFDVSPDDTEPCLSVSVYSVGKNRSYSAWKRIHRITI